MDPKYRQLFNAQFTPERYAWMQRELERRLECTFEFRLAETPIFLTADFEQRIVDAANAIVVQLSDPARIAAMKRAIPARCSQSARSQSRARCRRCSANRACIR